MANTVAEISSNLAARSLDINEPEQQQAVHDAFLAMSKEAEAKFAPAFTETGQPLAEQQDAFKAAVKSQSATRPVIDHMPALLEKLGNRADFNQTIDSANFRDVISLVANELGASDISNLSGPEIIAMLHQVVPENDYYAKNIDTTPVGEHDQFTVDQQRTLNLTLRGANATWMTTQIHRAAWEGATDRIDPSKREAFNPYDLMKQDMYQKLVDEGFSPQQALVRVAFEVDKDRDVLKRTVQAKLAEVDSASVERHST